MKYVLCVMTFLSLFMAGNLFSSSANTQEKVKIWGAADSPYVRKVVSVLEEKKMPYELEPVLPIVVLKATGQNIPEAFAKASPLGKIPAMEHKGFSVSDSAVITAYLEKIGPNRSSVYPANPVEYAKAIWFEKYADTTISDVIHKIFVEKYVKPNLLKAPSDESVVDACMKNVPAILSYLENSLKETQSLFLVGNKISIGDMAIVHHFYDLKLSEVQIDWSAYPHLSKYLERTLAHPSIQKAIQKM
jgi:glutathione S-transferase